MHGFKVSSACMCVLKFAKRVKMSEAGVMNDPVVSINIAQGENNFKHDPNFWIKNFRF